MRQFLGENCLFFGLLCYIHYFWGNFSCLHIVYVSCCIGLILIIVLTPPLMIIKKVICFLFGKIILLLLLLLFMLFYSLRYNGWLLFNYYLLVYLIFLYLQLYGFPKENALWSINFIIFLLDILNDWLFYLLLLPFLLLYHLCYYFFLFHESGQISLSYLHFKSLIFSLALHFYDIFF